MIGVDQLSRGFADPARDAQKTYRAILRAMAHPGRIETLDVFLDPLDGINGATGAVALTLLDQDSPVWISASLHGATARWLSFHCGCPIVEDETLGVAFAIVGAGDTHPPLDTASLNDPQRPDLSTTLIRECLALNDGPQCRATGPGIDGEVSIAPRVRDGFWAERNALRSLLPLGVDLILTAGSQIMALPRTTHVEELV
jgi:alpha-D-ribose 1-methylphosphonate 5-triphosphate synthase subunit PhnH